MLSYDLQITQGTSFNLSITVKDDDGNPLDLTNYRTSGQFKRFYSDTTYTNLNVSISTPTGGIITLDIPYNITAILPIGIGVYDINLLNTGSNYSFKPLAGNAFVYPQVTF